MQRWLRIFVLVLVVMPLGDTIAQLLPPARCAAQMAMGHVCCPQHTEIAAPSCCQAKADSYLTEGTATADAAQINVASQLVSRMPAQLQSERGLGVEQHTTYISILVPALILRT
jgi:hypothetical protein